MLENTNSIESTLTWLAALWPAALVIVSFAVAVILTALCEKIAPLLGVVDKPDNIVKTHGKATPYLGGVAIFFGMAAGMLTDYAFALKEKGYCSCAGDYQRLYFGMLIAGAAACITGTLDDIFSIKPWQKITGQVAAATVLVAAGVTQGLVSIGGSFGLVINAAFVLFFVLGATNSLNLLDGLDGLCAGVTAIMTIGMLTLSILMVVFEKGSEYTGIVFVLCLAQLPAICGFLFFNYPRQGGARIFMGDAGSLLLGLNMAAFMILFSNRPESLLGAIVIFGLPILDTAVAFARRIINKRPLFVPDRGHIYDQMMDSGMTVKKTVNVCYVFAALYSLAGIIISVLPLFPAFTAAGVVAAVSGIIIWRKGYLKMTGVRGAGGQRA